MRSLLTQWWLVCVAAAFHLVVTLSVSATGHFGLFPNTIDGNGVAIAAAPDGIKLLREITDRSEELAHARLNEWVSANSPLHVKLYSIPFAALKPLFGNNVLSAEPLNALYFVVILMLVFFIGRQILDQRTGLFAAAAVALWPSFLLHTTQLLRDPLFIAAMLGFALICLKLLSRDVSWWSGSIIAIMGGMLGVLLWLVRDTMADLVIAAAVLTLILLLLKQLVGRPQVKWRARAPAFLSALLLLTFVGAATRLLPKFQRTPQVAQNEPDVWQGSRRQRRNMLIRDPIDSSNPWSRFVARVGKLRQGFALEFSDAGSNIDSDVSIVTTRDLISYLPRAAAIGFFAPFPQMWFRSGVRVSRAERMVSGVETFALYLIEFFAVLTLWERRRQVSVWFVWLLAAVGFVSLGLVVINVGTLYRMRYVFAILMIVLAMHSISKMIDRFRASLRSSVTYFPQGRFASKVIARANRDRTVP